MSVRPGDLRLRMEMLRLRGELQRADAATAWGDIRVGTRGIRALAAAALQLGSSSSPGAGWVAALMSAMHERPWLIGLAMFFLRTARRHPVASVVAAVAGYAAVRVLLPAAPQQPAGPPPDAADLRPD